MDSTQFGTFGHLTFVVPSDQGTRREHFFQSLKIERVWQRDNAHHTEAASAIADYIVNCDNGMRLHSKLGICTQCLEA